jgi:5-methyltetrahydrofolate--homocysteine methyltransferase
MVSGTITDASGRTLSGQTAEAFLVSVSHLNLLSVGFNCALGAKQLTPYLETFLIIQNFSFQLIQMLVYLMLSGNMMNLQNLWLNKLENTPRKKLINIIGGCCGTTPEHIKAIADLVKNYEPRKINVII